MCFTPGIVPAVLAVFSHDECPAETRAMESIYADAVIRFTGNA